MTLLPWLLLVAATTDLPDVAQARVLFEKTLAAIANRDRAAYLACYLDADTLARTGPEGFALGYAGLEKSAGDAWPDTFEALDLRRVPVRDGVVYGTERERVRYGAEEHAGLSERVFLKTPAGWRIAVSTAFDGPPGTPPAPRALVGATLLDGTGAAPVPDAVVIVREGKNACAGSRMTCPVPADVAAVDVSGQWITPGLVDAHVHFGQTGWADGRPDTLDVRDIHPYETTQAELEARPERFFQSYLCSGVTSVFDVGGYPWTVSMAKRANGDTRAPFVAAAGPLLTTHDHWLNVPASRQFIFLQDEASARGGVRYLKAIGAPAVKVWYIVSAERSAEQGAAAVLAAGDEARKLGLPLIVHATGLAEAKIALRAGARLLVHSVGDASVDAEFLELARANGTIYTPTLTVGDGYRRMFEAVASGAIPAVDDPNACVDAATKAKVEHTGRLGAQRIDPGRAARLRAWSDEQQPIEARNLERIRDAGLTIAMGTDAGNPLTLHGPSVYAEMEAMQRAGLLPVQVLVSATRGGSQAMGRDKDTGTLEKGKTADLLVVGSDPSLDIAHMRRLRQVMRGGVLRSIEELRAVVAASAATP